MKALISPIEPRDSGWRVCELNAEEFPVAPPYFWVDAPEGTSPDYDFYNPTTQAIERRKDVTEWLAPVVITQGLGSV